MTQVDIDFKKELILRHVAQLAHIFAGPRQPQVVRPLPLDVESAVSAGIVTPEEIGNYFKAEIMKIL